MSIIDHLTEALASKLHELRQRRKKQQERILNSFSDKNNGLEPTCDRNGRLHAPCDGYSHFETGELYGKGQYILMPEYDDWYGPSFVAPASFDPRTRFKAETSFYATLVELLESYHLRVRTGRHWMEGATEYCYFTATGHAPLITAIQIATEAFYKARQDEERQNKGVAPQGKKTVTCKIQGIKAVESNFGYKRIDTKMIIVLDNGATAYGTMPKNLIESGVIQGQVITLTATFSPDKGDCTHAFFSRPCAVAV